MTAARDQEGEPAEAARSAQAHHALAYRPEIDGLRALAVLPVILFHAGFVAFDGGYVGVDVFFVISGYLITTIILRERAAGRFTLAGFYERRARRILPALFFVMLCCLPFAWAWMTPEQLQDFAESLVAVVFFAANFLFDQESSYFAAAADLKPLLHTWSLAVEEQFYLVFPLLLLALWRFGRGAIAAIMAVTALGGLAMTQWGANFSFSPPFVESLDAFAQPDWATFYLTPSRIWELQVGVLAAFWLDRQGDAPARRPGLHSEALAALGLAAILFAVFTLDRQSLYPSLWALLPTLGAALIILYARSGGLVARLLSLRPIVFVGLISYSAYLWHQPLLAFARVRHPNRPGDLLLLGLCAAALVLGWLTWRYVERPFRERRLIPARRIVAAALPCAALLVGIGLFADYRDGFYSRFPQQVLEALDAGQREARQDAACHQVKVEGRSACAFGDLDSAETVLLIGNSHARTLVPALGPLLSERGLKGLHYHEPNECASIPYRPRHFDRQVCRDFSSFVLREARENPAITRLVISHRWTASLLGTRFDPEAGNRPEVDATTRERASLMTASLENLLRTEKPAVLVYPIPETGFHVPRALFWDYREDGDLDPEALTIPRDKVEARNSLAESVLDAVAKRHRVGRVRPLDLLCRKGSEGECRAVDGQGRALYFDDNHLNKRGATPLAEAIGAQL